MIKDKGKQPNNTAAMDVHSHSIDDETNVDVTQLRGIKGPLEVIRLRRIVKRPQIPWRLT